MNEPLLHTMLMAQVAGLYLIIMAIVLVSRAEYYRGLFSKVNPESGLVVVTASIGLIVGLLMVLVHNTWSWRPDVLVTLLAWIIVLKSALWLSFPEKSLELTHRITKGGGFYVIAAIMAILGIHLLVVGFYHHL